MKTTSGLRRKKLETDLKKVSASIVETKELIQEGMNELNELKENEEL
jgi:hypothetical protein